MVPAYVRCPQCSTVVEKPAVGDPVCPKCGFGAAAAPTAKPAKKAAAKKAAKAPASATAPAPPARMPPPSSAPAAAAWTAAPPAPPAPAPPAMGAPFSDPGAPVPVTSGKAVAAMVVGIVSCCLPFLVPLVGPFLALPGGIVALVLGIVANKECTREPQRFKGKGMAVTGIVLGSIMIVVGVLLIVAVTVGMQAIEDALCEDDPNSDECQQFRDRYGAEAGPGPLAGLRAFAAGLAAAPHSPTRTAWA